MPFGEMALMTKQQKADIGAAKGQIKHHIQAFKEALDAAGLKPVKCTINVPKYGPYYLGTDFRLRDSSGRFIEEDRKYSLMHLLLIATELSHLTNPGHIEKLRQEQLANA